MIAIARKFVQGFGAFGGGTEYRPQDRSYSVRFPGKPTTDGDNPLKGEWRLNEVAMFTDPRRTGEEVYVAAHGFPPKENFPLSPSEEFINGKLREELVKSTGGTIVKETPITHGDATVREYEVQMPDGVSKRVVRIARTAMTTKVFYLAVEGPFVTADLPEVREFFRSFRLLKR